jgi:2-polyprenyl-3-methyl-5-hydroxy-6-metoxy-1,4-benzoquinol methylase
MSVNTTNFEKFQTGNFIVRRLIGRFFAKIQHVVASRPCANLLDAGCGEGMTLYQLNDLLPDSVTAFDLNPACVEYTKSLFPAAEITVQNIYELPYKDHQFELVLCLEVLEHLPDPLQAIRDLKRVAAGRLVLSVPYEPWFRLGSFLRGKYLKSWGNHPEHINHWSTTTFKAFLEQEFDNVTVDTSFPWIIAEVVLTNASRSSSYDV